MKNYSNKLLRYLVLVWAMIGATMGLTAQSFPVSVSVQTIGPAPTQLSAYADATQPLGPLRATLVLNDLNLASRQVRLQLSFQGGGISFQSVAVPVGAAPLFLDGGIPLTLGAAELAPYFNPDNLRGIAPATYAAPLPEGSYQICFEVFDHLTGKRLSARSCARTFIFQSRPPMLVLPANRSQVEQREPQGIVFQWTPRQLNVSNVEYELSLVELWDTGVDPQAAFLSAPPIFQTTTRATSYLYGPADPLLLPNRTYGWRVRARPANGADDVSLFQNQGYSEIYSFVHLAPCEVPPNLRHETKGARQANILWDDPTTEVPEFTVRYREQRQENIWYTNSTSANWTTLWNLKPGTHYEYQLRKYCGPGESGWSPLKEFTTPLETEEEDLYQCGISPGIDIANQNPLPELHVGEQFTAGDFTVTVTLVNGGDGFYSGKGLVRIPYLGNVRLAVRFENIKLNTDRQLILNTVVTEFDPSMRNIVDTGDVVDTVGEVVGAIAQTLEVLFEQLVNAEIDKTTRQNIENLTELLVEQAKVELPKPIADAIEDASNRMLEAKEKYDDAIQNGNQSMASEAEAEFTNAQNDLRAEETARDDFLDAYASIIKDALKEIVKESDDNLNDGLSQYGEENIEVTEKGETLELDGTSLDQLSNVFQPKIFSTDGEDTEGYFEYERWKMLNYISANLQTDEGTQELGNVLENEGEKIGIYIYNRLEEGAKKNELTTEVKELMIEIITEQISLNTQLY